MRVMLLSAATAAFTLLVSHALRSEPDHVWNLELQGRYKRYRGYLTTIATNPTASTRRLAVSVPHARCENYPLNVRIESDTGEKLFDGEVGCTPVEVPVPPERFVTIGFFGQEYYLSLWLR